MAKLSIKLNSDMKVYIGEEVKFDVILENQCLHDFYILKQNKFNSYVKIFTVGGGIEMKSIYLEFEKDNDKIDFLAVGFPGIITESNVCRILNMITLVEKNKSIKFEAILNKKTHSARAALLIKEPGIYKVRAVYENKNNSGSIVEALESLCDYRFDKKMKILQGIFYSDWIDFEILPARKEKINVMLSFMEKSILKKDAIPNLLDEKYLSFEYFTFVENAIAIQKSIEILDFWKCFWNDDTYYALGVLCSHNIVKCMEYRNKFMDCKLQESQIESILGLTHQYLNK